MPENEKYVDNSIHNVTGNVITGHAHVREAITVIYQAKSNIEWEMMLNEYRCAIERMSQEQYKVFSAGFSSLEEALKQKDESKLKQCANRLGEFGIGLLQGCSANMLADSLMNMIR